MRKSLSAPRDIASLAVFRALFGALIAASSLRFMSNGWIDRFYGERTFFFEYWGFSFVRPLSVTGMYGVYALIALLASFVALGLFYRVSIVSLFVLFSYTELIDVTNYLNHYYLVSLLALLMSFMPLEGAYSLDALRKPELARSTAPAFMPWLMRFQVGVVYVGAALGKLGNDWLVHGQPLNLWLTRLADVPFLGRYLALPEVALAASWAGFLHDLLIVPLLMWKRTRGFAFLALVVFHTATSSWFNIGIFPLLMPLGATLFFDPAWPRRLFGTVAGSSRENALEGQRALSMPSFALLLAYSALQVVVPLRTHLYGGNVLWHEQGMRFSWRVMLRDKHGSVTYRVELADGREVHVPPRRYLSSEQESEMSGQPDLILQLAHHIADDLRARGVAFRAVRASALASLNGRRPAPLIDPDVDLSRVEDGLALARYITPAPDGPPARLSPKPPALRVATGP